jgi:peptidoglycan/xylan/chitin deacetylase (PgdA/CDA1 family)
MPHLLSIDLEDWYLDVASVAVSPRTAAAALGRQLAALEAILDAGAARATFFVLGTTAERYPDHVARLHAAGHEIASHGYQHARIPDVDRRGLERDIARSSEVLASITGVRPIGYRAPYFSLPQARAGDTYDILAAHGYRYSSSTRGASAVRHSAIREVPTSAFRVARVTMPFGGGGYWRALPAAAVVGLVRAHEWRGARIAAYLHPHELDPDPLEPQRGGLRRAYVNFGRRGIARLLRRLLERFEFRPYATALDEGDR